MTSRAIDFIKLMRPHQWIKNGFIFVGILFGHMWSQPGMLLKVVLTAIAFSLISSTVYVINDVVDRENDRAHFKKKNRPIANGSISISEALIFAPILLIISLSLGWVVSAWVVSFLCIYTVINIGYSFWLKEVVILDIFIIATGFSLRVLAGTIGVGITPSRWLLLTTLMLTLFLGFAKRRAEVIVLSEQTTEYRKVLEHYSPALLDTMISITAACTLMTYGLYTMSPETCERHGTNYLIVTLPFLMYAIFRYIYLLHHHQKGAEPSKEIFNDLHILVSITCWIMLLVWLVL